MNSKSTLVILGAGGFAREVACHYRDTRKNDANWAGFSEILFVDDVTETIEVVISNKRFKVIKDWNFPDPKNSQFLVGIGSPKAKKIMADKALEKGLEPAITLVHPRALVQDASYIGRGGVITPGVVVTTNVVIGDYVILNLNTTVGHDAKIEDFCTVNPSCSISGNTLLGRGVTLGTDTVTREKSTIAPGVTVGAQSAVIKDLLEEDITAIGCPAKKLER